MKAALAVGVRLGPAALLARGVLTLLIGAILALLLLVLYARSLLPADLPSAVTLEPLFSTDGARGSVTTKSGLAVYADRRGIAQARLRLPDAYIRYPFLALSLAERSAVKQLSVYAGEPGSAGGSLETMVAPLPRRSVIFLGARPDWQAGSQELHLLFRTEPGSRVIVEFVQLQQLSPMVALGHFAWAWNQTGFWSSSSPNFFRAAPGTPVFLRPVAVAGCLLLLGTLGMFLLDRVSRVAVVSRRGMAVAFLLLWMFLDLRWQRELLANVAQSRELYWNKAEEQKQLAGPEQNLVRFAQQINQVLETNDESRVFVSSSVEFLGMRMAYYLLPYNVFWERGAPLLGPEYFRPGDFIVLLQPSEMRLGSGEQLLVYPDGRELAVRPLISGGAVLLLRVI
ncbi:MAG: hypothetical protein AB8B57_09135 [Congregibacter sp.]